MNTLADPKCKHCNGFIAWHAPVAIIPLTGAMVHEECCLDYLSQLGEIRLTTAHRWTASQQPGSEDADVAA